MNTQGVLYIVSTPIGNLADITYRAVEILRSVAIIAAEDTRHTRKLLDHYQIKNQLVSFHEHNELEKIDALVGFLAEGKDVALVSDAGTPLINDPGFNLVNYLSDTDYQVVPIPGACALIAALSVSGMPCDHFSFQGFLPVKSVARQKKLALLLHETSTTIVYEAPHRVLSLLEDIVSVFGPDRKVCLARELTKNFETVKTDKAQSLRDWVSTDKNQQRGECVLLIEGKARREHSTSDLEISQECRKLLDLLNKELPPKKAAQIAAEFSEYPKKQLYEYLVSS